MALGENEPVVLAVHLVEHDEHRVDRRQITPEVPDAAFKMHLQQASSRSTRVTLVDHQVTLKNVMPVWLTRYTR